MMTPLPEAGASEAPGTSHDSASNGKLILFVEDNADFRHLYGSFLRKAGYRVMEAIDGEEALLAIKQQEPSLVLLDLRLPGLSGFDVLQRIRMHDRLKETPVIIFSVVAGDEALKRALALGATDYAVKGLVPPKTLLKMIETRLGQREGKNIERQFTIFVAVGRGEANEVASTLRLSRGFSCPRCGATAGLELTLKPSDEHAHLFEGKFVCSNCRHEF